MEITHIFFDADNTIIDFSGASRSALSSLFEFYQIAYRQDYAKIYDEINLDCWRSFELGNINKNELIFLRFDRFFQKIGVQADPQDANAKYLALLVEKSQLIPGAVQILQKLKSRYRLFIITNGFKEVQRPKLTRLGLDTYFENIIVSDEIGMKKPEPRFFDYCLEKAGSPSREKVIVIGDSLSSDIKGAYNSQLKSIWYNPHGRTWDENFKGDFIISDLEEILQIL